MASPGGDGVIVPRGVLRVADAELRGYPRTLGRVTGQKSGEGMVTVRAERLVAGGAALARDGSGKVVLVDGALPGELVAATVTTQRKDVSFAAIDEVIEGVPGRVIAPCPHVSDGCGGCDLQHAVRRWQPRLKLDIVRDALRRQGGIPDPNLVEGPVLDAVGGRTTVRAAVGPHGRAGLRRRGSHELVMLEGCLVAHPLVEEMLLDGRFPPGAEVTLRCGAASGDRMVVVDGGPLDAVEVPEGVLVVGADGRGADRRREYLQEKVAGRWWNVSARSFFQARPEGAEALVAAVSQALRPADESGSLVDLYSGVGLFAGTLRDSGWTGPIAAVERSGSSSHDAKLNLAVDDAEIVRSSVERWRPVPAAAVVADPAREGLGQTAVERISGTGAEVVVLVSCDAAALGRDASLLAGAGYELDRAELVDLFPHTHHVEVVSRFRK